MARAVFDQVNIVCLDLEASLAFYRRLGADIPPARVWRTGTGTHHASAAEGAAGAALDLDSAAFAAIWNAGWVGRDDLAGHVVVGFRVTSRAEVDAIYAELTGAGHRGLQPPYDAFWGARYAVIEDPDGLAVGIMSPIAAEKRAAPPKV